LTSKDDLFNLLITPSAIKELDVYEGCCLAVIKIDFLEFSEPVR